MSFEGIGSLIGGVMLLSMAAPVVAAGATVLLAGSVTYAAVRGTVAVTRGLYHAYTNRQSGRDQRIRSELRNVNGRIGETARRQQERMHAIIQEKNEEYRQEVEARQQQLNAFQSRLEQMDNLEDVENEIHMEMSKSRQSLDHAVEREITQFQSGLQKACQEEHSALAREIHSANEQMMTEVENVHAMLDERQERYRAYAEEIRGEGSTLQRVLETEYDWRTLAPASMERARELGENLTRLLNEGNFRIAATAAVDYEDELLSLQSELEWKTAALEQHRLCVDTAMEELKAAMSAARDFAKDAESLTADGEILQGYVSETMEIDFWSEGRMTRLMEQADQISREAADFSGRNVAVLVAEIMRLTEKIRSEHARARAFLLNRAAVMKAAEEVLYSMQENGWSLAEDAGYQKNDIRNDFEMVFENAQGDRRDVTVCTEYDEAAEKYMVRIVRLAHERGTPDEARRSSEDEALNRSLADRGLQMNVSCNKRTYGMSGREGV